MRVEKKLTHVALLLTFDEANYLADEDGSAMENVCKLLSDAGYGAQSAADDEIDDEVDELLDLGDDDLEDED